MLSSHFVLFCYVILKPPDFVCAAKPFYCVKFFGGLISEKNGFICYGINISSQNTDATFWGRLVDIKLPAAGTTLIE